MVFFFFLKKYLVIKRTEVKMEYFLDSRKQLGFVVAVFFGFFIKKRFFPSKKTEKWKAPFTNDSRLPVSALEINQEKRGEILKKGEFYFISFHILIIECF